MNKYKIGKYIVKADSIRDAVTIVKTIKNSVKDANYQLRYNNGALANMSYLTLVKESPTKKKKKNLLWANKDEKFIYVDKKTKAAVYSSGEKIGTMADAVEKTGDSFQKDSLTVRDVIQSLINEETSAISSYNVALETLKDHIPAEAYEAIKAIRDDEQRHVENLYAVLNGNVTPKNLEN